MICSNELIISNENISSNLCCDKKNKTCQKRAGCSFAISPRAIPALTKFNGFEKLRGVIQSEVTN